MLTVLPFVGIWGAALIVGLMVQAGVTALGHKPAASSFGMAAFLFTAMVSAVLLKILLVLEE